MMFVPKRDERCLRSVAILQALALAAFFIGICPPGIATFADDPPAGNIKLVTTDYIETASISQGSKRMEGQQSESILANDIIAATQADHAFLLDRTYSQLTYRSAKFGSSLIRSPPAGLPGYRF